MVGKQEEHQEASLGTVQPSLWKHILWAFVALAALWALSKIPNTLIVFSTAWLISFLLNPAIDALEGRKLGPIKKCSRGAAVGLVTGLLVGLMIAVGSLTLPHLTTQVQRLLSVKDTISDPLALPAALREKAEPFLAKVPEAYREKAVERVTGLIQELSLIHI